MNRIEREKVIIAQMIDIYCRKRHSQSGSNGMCNKCKELLDYSIKRLDNCPKQNEKSSCRKCEIHCYAPIQKGKIREVMRYVGPRMIYIHPISAIRHIISELK